MNEVESFALQQLDGVACMMCNPYRSPKLHLVPCSSAKIQRGTDRHAHTQTAAATIHFAWLCVMKSAIRITELEFVFEAVVPCVVLSQAGFIVALSRHQHDCRFFGHNRHRRTVHVLAVNNIIRNTHTNSLSLTSLLVCTQSPSPPPTNDIVDEN